MTGCQLNTRLASPSLQETPPRVLAHMLTRMIDTGDRMRDMKIDTDWSRRRNGDDDRFSVAPALAGEEKPSLALATGSAM